MSTVVYEWLRAHRIQAVTGDLLELK